MSTTDLASPAAEVVKKALSRIGDIATLPEVTTRIIALVEDSNSTAADLHEVIRTDPALSARVLKVVNSAFYGLPGQVGGVDRAIVLLGMSAVKNITIAASIARMFPVAQIGAGYSAKDIWRHSVAVGVAARLITAHLGRNVPLDEPFLSGLIHDLGILVEVQAFPVQFRDVVERCAAGKGTFLAMENENIGADHQAFGEGLATKWKFPRSLRAAVGYHHRPEQLSAELADIGHIVRVADVLSCRLELGFPLTAAGVELTDEMLAAVNLSRDAVEGLIEQLHDSVEDALTSLSG